MNKIFDVIDEALARAGYCIMDGESNCVIVRDSEKDVDYCIKIEEIAL